MQLFEENLDRNSFQTWGILSFIYYHVKNFDDNEECTEQYYYFYSENLIVATILYKWQLYVQH